MGDSAAPRLAALMMSEEDPRIDWHWTIREWYQFGCPEAQHVFEEWWFDKGGKMLIEFDRYCADDDASRCTSSFDRC